MPEELQHARRESLSAFMSHLYDPWTISDKAVEDCHFIEKHPEYEKLEATERFLCFHKPSYCHGAAVEKAKYQNS